MRGIARVCIVLLGALALAGCGLFGDKDDPRAPMELEDIDTPVPVDRLWSRSTGHGSSLVTAGLAPFHTDGEIWVADPRGRIGVFDAETGRALRDFDVDLPLSAGPAVYDERVLLGTVDGQIVVMSRRNGEIEWRAQLSSEILSRPLFSEGIVVVRCIDGRVFGLDAETGRREWVYDRSVPLLTLRGNSAPVLRGGQIFVGHDDGAVTALDLEGGELLWEQRVSTPEGRTQLDRLADIDGRMAIVGLDLYAVTRHGRMASLALDSGRILWVKDLASSTGVSVSRTQLAASDTNDQVWLVDRRSGSTQWINERLLRRGLTRPVFQGQLVVVADRLGYVHWLSADSGEIVARERPSNDPPAAPPLVVGNRLYLLDRDGKLSAWRIGAGS